MICDSEFFDRLWSSKGSVYTSVEDMWLLYELYTESQYTNIVHVKMPPVNTKILDSWPSTIKFIEQSHIDLYDILAEDVELDGNTPPSPTEVFGSVENLVEEIVKFSVERNYTGTSVSAITLECDSRSLELLFDDADMWGLGHGQSVLVIEKFDDWMQHNDYHDRPIVDQNGC